MHFLNPKDFGSSLEESSKKKGVCGMWRVGNKCQIFFHSNHKILNSSLLFFYLTTFTKKFFKSEWDTKVQSWNLIISHYENSR